MHVLFLHQNFPAQFGHIAAHLVKQRGDRCTFVSETPAGVVGGIRKIQYRTTGGATKTTHFCSRTFENIVWHAAGIYDALRPLKDEIQPDLIVGHSGFGPTLFLLELFPGVPVINYFEYFYRPNESDIDFRKDFPASDEILLRSRARNASILLDLNYCAAGYTPTRFQHGLLPEIYRPKVRVLHDGIPTEIWSRRSPLSARAALGLPEDARVVTYVSRGFEAMRGFDIFMKAARQIYEADPRVVVLVVGSDRVCYGGDLRHITAPTFKAHVLQQDEYDLTRIRFLGPLPPAKLVDVFSASDVHIYLTVPFVLSWSLLNAMSCGCTVLASDTAPVREVVRHGENGLLCDFFDAGKLARMAIEVLRDPDEFQHLGAAAEELIREEYAASTILPRMIDFYCEVAAQRGA